jgi:hypothetical protein
MFVVKDGTGASNQCVRGDMPEQHWPQNTSSMSCGPKVMNVIIKVTLHTVLRCLYNSGTMNVHHADGTHECARLQATLGSVDAKSARVKSISNQATQECCSWLLQPFVGAAQ